MAWHKALLRLRVSLAVVMLLVLHTRAEDVCIWCDPGLSQPFLECVSASILKTTDFRNVPTSSMDDMKNSMLAAAGAMTHTVNSLKMSMMNGAMAGELAELVKDQSVSQTPEKLVKTLLEIVGNCYVEISGQSHHKFTGMIGSAVNSMLQVNADTDGPAPNSPQLPPGLGGQNINLYNNGPSLQQQQAFVANQATLNAASQNYQSMDGAFFYPNAAQNYQAPIANMQSNAQMYSMNNQQNNNQQLNLGRGPYPLNPQNKWLFYARNRGLQPGITNVNLNNNNQNVMPNNAPPLLQNNQLSVANYDQNNQPNQNNQRTVSLFTPNGQGIPQNINTDGGTLNQRNVYPSNKAPIATTQTVKSVVAPDAVTAPQPKLTNPIPVVTKSPSSTVLNSPVIRTGNQVNIKPQSNIRPEPTIRRRRPKRPRAKTPSPNVTPAPVTKGNNADIENAIKFAETIYFILCKSSIFTGTFNKDLPNGDAVSITFNMIKNALNACGYSKFALDIANACVVQLTALPEQCATEIYAEAIAKSLMTQFYKIGLIGTRPGDQASSLAISILKELKQIVRGAPSESTTPIPSTDSTTSFPPTDSTTSTPSTDSTTSIPSTDSPIATTSSNTDVSVRTQDSSPSDSASTDINTQFYNALYDSLCKSLYFRTVFGKQSPKSDVISWAVQMLISLSEDYGKRITVKTARECTKRMATLPDGCPLELLAEIICNCITDVFSDNGLISQVTPVDQAIDIASKFNIALIDIIDKITDNTPISSPQLQNTGNVPVNNLQLQPIASTPVLNSNSQNINNGQTTDDNTPASNSQLQNTGNARVSNLFRKTSNIPVNSQPQNTNNGQTIPQTTANNQQSIIKPVNSITNANSNANIQISKQKSVSPGNLVAKNINIDNTPTTQIFPDDDSDESKQRIQILMKWAISSINNGKFNYKVFSSVISALAQVLQKTHPDLGAQKALFKVLLESIVALSQLLVQAPPSTFAIQNSPNTNGPYFLNTNVGNIKNANVPLIQNSNIPSSQNVNVPVLQNVNAPLLQNANVPFLQNANAPLLQNTNIPANTPFLQNTNTPANSPLLQNANAPLLQNTNIPNSQNANNVPMSPIPSQDVVQNNQNYPGAQQNNYNSGQPVNTDAFATGANNYAAQQGSLYSYGPPQQLDGNVPGQGSFEVQQQAVTNWNNEYITGQGNENSFLPVQNSYAFQQGPAPGQGNLVMNGQNNFPASQAAFGVQDVNGNLNGAPYDFQSRSNDPNLNQQNYGSYFTGNPNPNRFLQNTNMQAGYQK